MYIFTNTKINELTIIEPKVFFDIRGKFIKKFHNLALLENDVQLVVKEEIISISKQAALRGLHFQTKNPQAKLVSVLKGKIYDVAVDLRLGSPTYGIHYGLELTSENNLILYIPEGFAHGFLSLEEDTIVSYLCSTEYEPEHDSGIRFDDPDLDIQWPELDMNYIISEKDLNLPNFKDFKGFNIGNYED